MIMRVEMNGSDEKSKVSKVGGGIEEVIVKARKVKMKEKVNQGCEDKDR